jgi:lysophospholipase L1-like esterase
MRIFGISLAALIGLLSVIGANAAESGFPLTARRIVFLGDSITAAGHYIVFVETQLRLAGVQPLPELINLGLASETVTGLTEPDHPFPRPDVHERLDRALKQLEPDVIVACYGVNDGIYAPFNDQRFQAYQEGIRKLIEKSHAAGAKVILLTPPPFDPLPMEKSNKLLPAGSPKFGWTGIYERYEPEVLAVYADWILQQGNHVEQVIDVHTPINDFLRKQRSSNPGYVMSTDGIHVNQDGHRLMAQPIVNAWGVPWKEDMDADLLKLVTARQQLLHRAWVSSVGHQRPGVAAGLPLEEARSKAAEMDQKIRARLEMLRQ